MPILSSAVFDNTGKPYDVTKVLTPDFLFDQDAYERYSPVYLPITYVLSYAVQFASLSALVTHTVCWHGKDIWEQTKQSLVKDSDDGKAAYQAVGQSDSVTDRASQIDQHLTGKLRHKSRPHTRNGEDVHHRLMQRYEDAPLSWYLCTFIAMLAIGIFVVE
jgi:hypothetical protein